MKKLGILLILSILLVSCSKSQPIGKYQAIQLRPYEIIIINTTNGECQVWKQSSSLGNKWEYEESFNEFKK
jgi:hypothetical protein